MRKILIRDGEDITAKFDRLMFWAVLAYVAVAIAIVIMI